MNRPTRSRVLAVLAALALPAVAAPAFAADEYAVAASSGLHTGPTGTATSALGPGQDDAVAVVSLPFEFPFFGRLHTQVSVCTNGWLAFGSTSVTASADAALPDAAAPNGIVAALWDDLATGTGRVETFTEGTAPNRVFVVSWVHVDTFSPVTTADLSFQVRLHEGTGVIDVAYDTAGTWDGLSYAAGIEDPTGTVAFGAGSLANGRSGQPASDWVFTPRASVVSGTLLRDRPAATETGLGTSTETDLPVAGIDLEVVLAATGDVVARGRTDDAGDFAFDTRGLPSAATLAIDLLASGVESRVVDGNGAVHRYRLASSVAAAADADAGTLRLGASADAENAGIRRAVNVQQAAQRAFSWARDAAEAAVLGTSPAIAAESFARLDFRFVPGTAATSGLTHYVRSSGTTAAVVNVNDAGANPDPWDDDRIVRECGHHVFATICAYPDGAVARAWATATTAPYAFADGFGLWFSGVVAGRARLVDTKTSTTADVLDLEAESPLPARSPAVAGAVACSLWDLVDEANESWDTFAGTRTGLGSTAYAVFRTVDVALEPLVPGAPGTADIGAFFSAWATPADPAAASASARDFIHHGTLADDAREPNDLAAEASAAGATQRLDGLVLTPWNEDRFAFASPSAGDAALAVTFTQTGATGVEVSLLDGGGAVVASATNDGDTPTTRVTATTDGPVAPGTYTVRVVWRSGAAASYSLAFYEPLRIDTPSLPAWTAGRAYKADVVAGGGVPPLTFTTTASVPGLSLAEGGSRLTGVPSAAGTYPVTVRVTDASGAGTQADAEFQVLIHAPLAMPQFVGLAAGHDVAVDVGTGGTGASWTSPTTPGGGLLVQSGATLRLGGVAGVPRALDVLGSATDVTGAVLDDATTRVVVCALVPKHGQVPVVADEHFGLWFDAVEGSDVDLRFRFRGTGGRPEIAALVDPSGAAETLSGRVDAAGRTVRLHGFRTPRSGRWFVIFRQAASPLTGTVSVAGDVRVPRDAHGVAVIATPDAVAEVAFDAPGASYARIELRREQVPDAPRPAVFGLTDPIDDPVTLPASRPLRGGGVEIRRVLLGEFSGTYVLRIVGDGERTGPVFWRVRLSPPRRTFSLY